MEKDKIVLAKVSEVVIVGGNNNENKCDSKFNNNTKQKVRLIKFSSELSLKYNGELLAPKTVCIEENGSKINEFDLCDDYTTIDNHSFSAEDEFGL